jgi:radical SAM superfamily enzyme YgiQ (UPF0313 family)
MGVDIINIRDETLLPLAAVREFCTAMVTRKVNVSWRAFANIGVFSPDMFDLMAEAGCHMLFFGVEASDRLTLELRRKKTPFDRIHQDIRAAQSKGIFVRGGFIVDHETDSRQSFDRHARFLRSICPDELYISFLTPFPGTPLYRKLRSERKLLTEDLRLYDCEHPIVDIGVPPDELIALRAGLYRDFYNSKEWRDHLNNRISRRPHEERETIQKFLAYVHDRHGVPLLAERIERAA